MNCQGAKFAKEDSALDQTTAYSLIDEKVRYWEGCEFKDLIEFVGQCVSDRIQADDGYSYLLESTLRWKDGNQESIEIDMIVCVDNTGPLRRIDKTITIST